MESFLSVPLNLIGLLRDLLPLREGNMLVESATKTFLPPKMFSRRTNSHTSMPKQTSTLLPFVVFLTLILHHDSVTFYQ